jgi:GTPase Era involved in 16S rRNA processing
LKRSLVIGKINVGKTLFCIHFARYLGAKEFQWLVERTDGRTDHKRMSLPDAQRILSGPNAHATRCLQSVTLSFPSGKTSRQLLLTDTTGLTDGIHPEPDVREAMAQTLRAMVEADFILHVVDAAAIGRSTSLQEENPSAASDVWNNLDQQLVEFGVKQRGYIVLANKMDLPEAKAGYRALCKRFSKHSIMPVSAKLGTGFREVKQHVWRFS